MAHRYCMSKIDPDTTMIVAGVIISLIAASELYPELKRAARPGDR